MSVVLAREWGMFLLYSELQVRALELRASVGVSGMFTQDSLSKRKSLP